MAKTRSLAVVERDIKRVHRAEKKLRSNWNAIHRYLAKHGGIEGLPQKSRIVDGLTLPPVEPSRPPKLSVYVRHQREIGKALRLCLDELKSLEVERVALTAAEVEKSDEYSLA